MSRTLTASDLSTAYGFTPRYWTRLAAAGRIPGALQLSGRHGHWRFDRNAIRQWAREQGYPEQTAPTVRELEKVKKPKRKECPEDHVYFLYSAGLVKIGVSNNHKVRHRSFKTASPVPITLLLEMVGSFKMECELHKRFEASHSHGEWFHLSADLRAFINGASNGAVLSHAEAGFRLWLKEREWA